MERSEKHLKYGPGGRSCTCCFPAPGSKERKYLYRKAKKDAAKAAFDCEKVEDIE